MVDFRRWVRDERAVYGVHHDSGCLGKYPQAGWRRYEPISENTARVYQVDDVIAARKKKNSWWYLVQFGGYEGPEWVRDKHLEDAGTWVQDRMTAARMAGTAVPKATEPTRSRRSPRLAQTMNRMGHQLPGPHTEEDWFKSQTDYEVLGM